MMNVKLAGYNVDKDGLDEITRLLSGQRLSKKNKEQIFRILDNSTPETISAAYARISRSEKPIAELRKDAANDVEKARESNDNIIFGIGHSSIAEHAVFNFDVEGVSRRLVEDIEKQRLVSFTEKSQRYVTLDNDYVIPNEIKRTPLENEFVNIINSQNNFYHNNIGTLTNFHKKIWKGSKPARTIKGYGKEDARYGVSIATEASIGMTINARNVEKAITYLKGLDYDEANELAQNFINETKGIAPSLIKYVDATDYDSKTRPNLRNHVDKLIKNSNMIDFSETKSARVSHFDIDKSSYAIGAALIFSSSNLSYEKSLELFRKMSTDEKIVLMHTVAHKYQKSFDPKLREFELTGRDIFEFDISSSAFAQLKRHRIGATLISQKYNPTLGYTTPKSIDETGLGKKLFDVVNLGSNFYNKLVQEGLPVPVAEMILTNAHHRRVLFSANPREIYAFAALRLDEHAQWDIKNYAKEVFTSLKNKNLLTYAGLCGKDNFDKVKLKLNDFVNK
jgi:thymidylate synthase ThyX